MAQVKGLARAQMRACVGELLRSGRVDQVALREVGLSAESCQAFLQADGEVLDAALRWLELPGHHLLAWDNEGYPELLRGIASPPTLLFIIGNPQALQRPQLAMVGSRRYSHYGEHWAAYFAAGLVQCGFTITSGLAIGIDGICHRAALEAGGDTVAVLGSGLLHLYPRRHRALAEQIVASDGALVSELFPTAPPLAAHFPQRNRIISGLSFGVVIVESQLPSGSLITARCALDQGRDIFALPGSLASPTSAGTHWLIQQGAYLVTHPREIAEQLGSGLTWLPPLQDEIISGANEEGELPFPEVLANVGDEVTPINVVAARAGQPVPDVVVKLLELELAGWIAAVPGGYVRLRRAGHVRRTDVPI